jgi:hypothetical protein
LDQIQFRPQTLSPPSFLIDAGIVFNYTSKNTIKRDVHNQK